MSERTFETIEDEFYTEHVGSNQLRPTFEHDCPVCTFLGTVITEDNRTADLHICARENSNPLYQSVIARFSSEGPDYTSSPIGMVRKHSPQNDVLRVAATLAQARGLTNHSF